MKKIFTIAAMLCIMFSLALIHTRDVDAMPYQQITLTLLTPSDTPTPTPSETPTDTPTDTPTPVNTDTLTPAPADTSTPTLTPAPTDTITPTPTLAAIPTWYFDGRVTYGDYIQIGMMSLLCAFVGLLGLAVFVIIIIDRRK